MRVFDCLLNRQAFLLKEVYFSLLMGYLYDEKSQDDIEERFYDWLSIHKLNLNELKTLAYKFPPQKHSFDEKLEKERLAYTADEAWKLCATALVEMLPEYELTIRKIQNETPKCLSSSKQKTITPHTIDQGDNRLPFVSCYYMGKARLSHKKS